MDTQQTFSSIAIKPSPSANIRRLAEAGLDATDIQVITGYRAAEIKRVLTAKYPFKR